MGKKAVYFTLDVENQSNNPFFTEKLLSRMTKYSDSNHILTRLLIELIFVMLEMHVWIVLLKIEQKTVLYVLRICKNIPMSQFDCEHSIYLHL